MPTVGGFINRHNKSLIIMTNLNTELYDAFLEAGVREPTARAAAQSMISSDQVATKADIAGVKSKLGEMASKIAWLTALQQEQRWLSRSMFILLAGILAKLVFFSS